MSLKNKVAIAACGNSGIGKAIALELAGFGQISRTAGTSRQIQFSLKIFY